ncbi:MULTISPECIES: DegT/DnrJ/EryC1/StrS family aminotransferase [Prochlorococcus]|uniref:DegT/DnrJ/EryC1/StrS aminotransferase family enzyme n=1 Tax=Prochlorococcus marinus (strain SARG / CCMP1375 / SS120) TaxID=167539 RepID=Q7VDQ2_PROMA|nr:MULTISPECIES: DegT/DnrJ/EryC1/StrS family aminotransferase [Prochlorococcus]AAP99362.1 DegT/DnrJ/EryC1/StrS aminotransferase family enzyme [Prochlorococcus marinus subsp. marinus str. CCMP1375]KGG11367.1 putative pleiotropic regulatory protein [Prochlorococcus marinus str. LG]KGG18678.1 putative pleiotropic regulatory protein [Prochlorococcus marinus str. SS2]KGG22951.1 putative pleiotropic regulatory protein [Prochlorococcus marinus str. SS35]KGG34055.1 putative pleiotropic regulatory prot
MQVPPFTLEKQLSEIGQDLDEAVSRVVKSGIYIGGSEVLKFEQSFADAVGVSFAIGCNSGTDALVLALRALNIGPMDEVITPSFSFFATAEAISNVGATPVFVDVDPTNYLLDIELIEAAITPLTKAILPVHLFGCPVNMTKIVSLAKKNGIKVIEDCAQAVGTQWDGKPVGSIGDIGCFSFFPTKNLGAAGDAGAVTTNDPELAERIRELAIHGMPRRYFHTELGYNSRLDAVQAAILNVKLPILDKWITQRKEIAKRYINLLKGLSDLALPSFCEKNNDIHSWNQFVIRVKDCSKEEKVKGIKKIENICKDLPESDARDTLKDRLLHDGVNTIIYYPIPIHLQPAYKKLGYKVNNLPNTESLCSQVLSLPIFPELTLEEQEYVVNSIKKSLKD